MGMGINFFFEKTKQTFHMGIMINLLKPAGCGFEGVIALQGLRRKSQKTYFKNGR